mmetsp:Transcript_55833/g.122313  ORF Transcript_55833/g.122313 Transcript_55833/m.122313 type:complete len:518 (-) Transcript_55833:133-1686(-)|eukprot:CAMPEP_0204319202 /NCGR_PEP_ID=MMETSP0469-20131031/6971_1 /ASSEMBLY_ACC=CAM_ASM_000384 /TAXON_ID=2969 /ORGANISM="Oxyrrhis marina" /LENGTH=517 /DNA_ID=CAMNT_0051300353 /DNA_START=23 /DNA_END=1576 /DNA_ORIENTATION=-
MSDMQYIEGQCMDMTMMGMFRHCTPGNGGSPMNLPLSPPVPQPPVPQQMCPFNMTVPIQSPMMMLPQGDSTMGFSAFQFPLPSPAQLDGGMSPVGFDHSGMSMGMGMPLQADAGMQGFPMAQDGSMGQCMGMSDLPGQQPVGFPVGMQQVAAPQFPSFDRGMMATMPAMLGMRNMDPQPAGMGPMGLQMGGLGTAANFAQLMRNVQQVQSAQQLQQQRLAPQPQAEVAQAQAQVRAMADQSRTSEVAPPPLPNTVDLCALLHSRVAAARSNTAMPKTATLPSPGPAGFSGAERASLHKRLKPPAGGAQRTLLIAYFPREASEQDIKREFGRFGVVEGVHLVWDRVAHRPRCYGFVRFSDTAGATEGIIATLEQKIVLKDARSFDWEVVAEWAKCPVAAGEKSRSRNRGGRSRAAKEQQAPAAPPAAAPMTMAAPTLLTTLHPMVQAPAIIETGKPADITREQRVIAIEAKPGVMAGDDDCLGAYDQPEPECQFVELRFRTMRRVSSAPCLLAEGEVH